MQQQQQSKQKPINNAWAESPIQLANQFPQYDHATYHKRRPDKSCAESELGGWYYSGF